MTNLICNLFLIFFLLILLLGCVGNGCSMKKNRDTEKYEWLPSESAHKSYPMEIISGDFFYPNGNSIYIPSNKVINNGWGEVGSIHVVGEDFKPLPNRLKLKWFSYRENKFFSIDTLLPYEKLLNSFSKKIISPITGKKTRYDRIIVGLGGGGRVSVWVSGEWLTKEIQIFKAKEVTVEWSDFFDRQDLSREEMIRQTLIQYLGEERYKEIEGKVDFQNKWELYSKRYHWQLQGFTSGKLDNIRLSYFNGEKEYYKFDKQKLPLDFSNHSAPKRLDITWNNAAGKKYVAEIYLGEKEVFQVFEKCFNAQLKENLGLEIKLENEAAAIEILLHCGNYRLELKPLKIELYSAN